MKFPFKLPLILDGATGTNLIKAGMKDGVCPEQWTLEHKDVLLNLQKNFIKAGSNVLLTPTFGANKVKLADYGLDNKFKEMNEELVSLTKSIANENILVAGDVSTSGLMMQPYGEASFNDVFNVYFEQMQILKNAGVDFIFLATQMFLSDIRAGILAANALDIPIFVSMTLEANGRMIMGEEPLAVLATAQALGATAVGINCSVGPHMVIENLKDLVYYSTVPLIAKPNAGLPDETNPTEYDTSAEDFAIEMENAFDHGIYILGGCCGTTPEHIKALADRVKNKTVSFPNKKPHKDEICVVNGKAYFIHDDMDFSDKISCSYDMIDDILEIEDTGKNIILIELNTIDDSDIFFENVHMIKRPVAIISSNENVIEYTLRNFQGRLIVSIDSAVDKFSLQQLAKKYGAIIY